MRLGHSRRLLYTYLPNFNAHWFPEIWRLPSWRFANLRSASVISGPYRETGLDDRPTSPRMHKASEFNQILAL